MYREEARKFINCEAYEIINKVQESKFLCQHKVFVDYYKVPDKIHIGFHGTTKEAEEFIIYDSLLAPYQSEYKMKTGNVHGKGVYIGTNMRKGLQYARGVLFIVAYTKGLPDPRTVGNCQELEGDHNDVGDIMVLRAASQVLPLFVLYPDKPMNNIPIYEGRLYLDSLIDKACEITNENRDIISILIKKYSLTNEDHNEIMTKVIEEIQEYDYNM